MKNKKQNKEKIEEVISNQLEEVISNYKKIIFLLIVAIICLASLMFIPSTVFPANPEDNNDSDELKNITLRTEGYQIAIIELMQKSQNCEPIEIRYFNHTEHLINIKCLENMKGGGQDDRTKL